MHAGKRFVFRTRSDAGIARAGAGLAVLAGAILLLGANAGAAAAPGRAATTGSLGLSSAATFTVVATPTPTATISARPKECPPGTERADDDFECTDPNQWSNPTG